MNPDNAMSNRFERGRMPDFIGLGGSRCASTWLFENLGHHPEVKVGSKKETLFFNECLSRKLEDYAACFPDDTSVVTGEITPAYCYLDLDRIKYVHRLVPDAKLLLTIRNPIARSISYVHTRHLRESPEEPRPSDEELLLRCHEERNVLRSNFSWTLDRWLSVFPKEQMHIEFFDHVEADPVSVLQRIYRFLNVSDDPPDLAKYANRVYYGREYPLVSKNTWDILAAFYHHEILRLANRVETLAGTDDSLVLADFNKWFIWPGEL